MIPMIPRVIHAMNKVAAAGRILNSATMCKNHVKLLDFDENSATTPTCASRSILMMA